MNGKTLFCIVTNPTDPSQVKPDVGFYSPKELAFKEGVSTTSVYTWLKDGLPCMRQGRLGNIRIYYQDYIQWMIDCARIGRESMEIPSWAFRFVKATEPRVRFIAKQLLNAPKKVSRAASGAEKRASDNGQMDLFSGLVDFGS